MAEKLKLAVVTYDVDRSGRDPSGKVVNFPHAAQVVAAAFASDVGVDNDPIDADGGYVWYNVAGITPSRDRTLDEVKDAGREALARGRDRVAAENKIGGAPRQAQGRNAVGSDRRRRATESPNRRQVHARQGRGRRAAKGRDCGISDRQGCVRQRRRRQANDWVVFQVTDVTTPPLNASSPDAKRIEDAVKRQEGEEIYGSVRGLAPKRARHHRQSGGAGPSPR